MHTWELLVILAMIGLNGLFAAYEIALASVSIVRLQVLVKENAAGARAALYMKENFEASLATVQLGITLLGAIAAATGGVGAEQSLRPFFHQGLGLSNLLSQWLAIAVVVIPITVFTIVFGELVPKVFAFRNKELVCLRLSPGMRWFTFSVWPAIWLLESAVHGIMRLSELGKRREANPHAHEAAELQSLRASVSLARASRLIGEREETIILRAAKLSGRPIREIMLPAEYISMLDAKLSLAECLIAVHLDMHTRFPVAGRKDDPQSIIGYINLKDLLAIMHLTRGEAPTLLSILRPFPQLPDALPIPACLERMIREHTHIALVVDAEKKVVGMITMEDILEELVGEIEDEYDRLPAHVTPSGKSWIVGGGIGLPRLRELTGFDLAADPPSGGAATLSEWIMGHLGHGVNGGEEIQHRGVRVVVRKIRRQKVMEAQVSRAETGES
ncbi:MAG: HlyC/CorC family transporter [Pirellulales bacterium]|nr:HlyC/CorC family transporter [Pirellulales bacterium]